MNGWLLLTYLYLGAGGAKYAEPLRDTNDHSHFSSVPCCTAGLNTRSGNIDQVQLSGLSSEILSVEKRKLTLSTKTSVPAHLT